MSQGLGARPYKLSRNVRTLFSGCLNASIIPLLFVLYADEYSRLLYDILSALFYMQFLKQHSDHTSGVLLCQSFQHKNKNESVRLPDVGHIVKKIAIVKSAPKLLQ